MCCLTSHERQLGGGAPLRKAAPPQSPSIPLRHALHPSCAKGIGQATPASGAGAPCPPKSWGCVAAPTRLTPPPPSHHPLRRACEPRAPRRVQPPSAALGRRNGRLPSICAEAPLGAPRVPVMPSPRGPAAREGSANTSSAPSSPAGDGEVGGAPRTSSRSRPPASPRPLDLPHAPTMPAGRPPRFGPGRGYRGLPRPSVLCCPSSPLPRGPSGCSYLRPSSIRLSDGWPGTRPPPLPARAPRGQRMLRPLPARRCPPAAAPPGARGSAFALRARASRRVCGRPGGGEKAGGADPGSPGRR